MADFDDDELIQLSLLRDEETDELISAGLLDADQRLSAPLDAEVSFPHEEVILRVTPGLTYPIEQVLFELDNISLPREVVDTLRRHLREIVTSALETNNVERWRDREVEDAYGIFNHVRVIYQLADETTQHVQAYRSRHTRSIEVGHDSKSDKHLWFLSPDAKQAVPRSPIMTVSTKELAYQLLQNHPSEIAALIPTCYRVLHVEQVLRADLAQNLLSFQASLRRTLSNERLDTLLPFVPRELRSPRMVDVVDHLVKPRITFHGTQRQYVPSIVRHGFVLPGTINPETGERLDVRCGSTYGRGIYCTPSAGFSFSYSDGFGVRTSPKQFYGLKLIVCATIMGRSKAAYRDDDRRMMQEAIEGADSHVANNNLEYIVFSAAQIVPVYVIHIDWGADNAEHFRDDFDNPSYWASSTLAAKDNIYAALDNNKMSKQNQYIFAGDRQRARQAIHARAAKYFPYGYGPATGSKFVVEEVGEVSEDEEEYGDYQALRAEGDSEKAVNTEFWSWIKVAGEEEEKLKEGSHEADEYVDHRNASRIPNGFGKLGKSAKAWDDLSRAGEAPAEQDEDQEFGLALLMIDDAQDQAEPAVKR